MLKPSKYSPFLPPVVKSNTLKLPTTLNADGVGSAAEEPGPRQSLGKSLSSAVPAFVNGEAPLVIPGLPIYVLIKELFGRSFGFLKT